MVVAAARICSFPEIQCSAAALQLSWSRCIAVLMHYKEHVPSAPYAVQVLETLQRRRTSGIGEQVRLDAHELEDMAAEDNAAEQYLEALSSDWSCPLPDVFADFDFGWLNESSV
jgi:hypothetical protein